MSQYIRYPSFNGVSTYATFSAFPATANNGALALALDTDTLYAFNTTSGMWIPIGGPGSILTVGTIDSQTASANGAVITGSSLVMQSASATVPGLVNTAAQTFAGNKYFAYAQTGGTSLTTARLGGSSNLVCVNSFVTSVGYGSVPTVVGYRANGTEAAPTAVTVDQVMNAITARGHDGTSFIAASKGRISIQAAETWSLVPPANGTYMTFSTTPKLSTSLTERMRIFDDGNISIGNTTSSAKLSVTGTIISSSTISGTQLTSTITTGTAPLVVSSTTLVPNLYVARSVLSDTVTTNADLTGDVTSIGNATTIAANAVTNAKAAQMPTLTIKGNNTGGTADPLDLTVSQVQAMIGSTADVTLTAVGASPNANGASLSGQALTLQPANGSNPGVLTAIAQTIGGDKTLTGALISSNTLSLTYVPVSPLAGLTSASTMILSLTGNTANTQQAVGATAGFERVVTGTTSESGGIVGFRPQIVITNGANAYTNTNSQCAAIRVPSITVGATTPTITYSAINIDADATVITGRKNGIRINAPSAGTTGNAFITDNNAYSGDYFINSTSTRNSVLSGVVSVAGLSTTVTTDATTSVAITTLQSTILLSGTSGTIVATLPTAVGVSGRMYTIKRTGTGASSYTVATTSSQTIDGSTTYTLTAQYKYITVQSDGANWHIIANN